MGLAGSKDGGDGGSKPIARAKAITAGGGGAKLQPPKRPAGAKTPDGDDCTFIEARRFICQMPLDTCPHRQS